MPGEGYQERKPGAGVESGNGSRGRERKPGAEAGTRGAISHECSPSWNYFDGGKLTGREGRDA